MSSLSATAQAQTVQQQRALYAQAKQQLASNKISAYKKTKRQLENYPLYPYLEYKEIRRVIKSPTRLLPPVTAKRLENFEARFPGFPLRRALRQNWLWSLAKQPNKSTFITYYQDVKDRNLFCTYLRAKHAVVGNSDWLAKYVRSHWQQYGEPAEGCDDEVAALIRADKISNKWLVERLLQAMRKGDIAEIEYLQKRLPAGSSARAKTFLATDKDPRDRNTERANVARSGSRAGDDSLYTRLTVLHGIKKLARRNATQANALWQSLGPTYSFKSQDRQMVQNTLAHYAGRQRLPVAAAWLDAIPPARLTEAMRDSRLQIALLAEDWAGLHSFIKRLPADEQQQPQWQYWQARAASQLSQQPGQSNSRKKALAAEASGLYRQLAAIQRDDYYAFLAADRLNLDYSLRFNPTKPNAALQRQLLGRADIQRVQELLAIDKDIDARREWWALQKRLNSAEKRQSALLAHDWGWHRQSIGVLSGLGERGDLLRRYPLPWQNIIEQHARKNEIPASWAYGILRAESMYQADAKSHAGAYGLMQLMPPTAKQTAKRAGVPLRRNSQLYQPGTNIPLGTYYLGEMMNRFDGHAAVSTAAYNAGPNRVKRWLPPRGNQSVDIWVETIPYNETRRYVKKVMQYATVFDWRMRGQQQPRRLNELMPDVTPRGGRLALR